VDLVVPPAVVGPERAALRFDSDTAGLHRFFPNVDPREAWSKFLRGVLARATARTVPDAEALQSGRYPSYPDESALTRAVAVRIG